MRTLKEGIIPIVQYTKHQDIYEFIQERRAHVGLSDSVRPDLKDDNSKKKLGVFEDETHSLSITEFIALNPKVYSLNNQKLDEFNKLQFENKKTLKGISMVTVKNEITHASYVGTLEANKVLSKTATSLRSFNHNILTYVEEKQR